MFLGHIAIDFAGKRVAPKTSLGTLLLAPLFLDALWPIFLARGREQARVPPGTTVVTPLDFVSYPWSHSLSMAIVWSIPFAGVLTGSPPPNMKAVIASAFGLYILVPWGVWVDRPSRAVGPAARATRP